VVSTERDAATDQRMPEPGQTAVHQAVIDQLDDWIPTRAARDMVAAGLRARRELGVAKYGRPLESHNGRDAWQDCWEEVLDALVYAAQMRLEGRPVEGIFSMLAEIADRLAVIRLWAEETRGTHE
jgi:hypothetical protein